MLEINGIDADADLLDELQVGGRVYHLCRHRLEYVQQHIGVTEQPVEQRVVRLGAESNIQPWWSQSFQLGVQVLAACKVKYRAHARRNLRSGSARMMNNPCVSRRLIVRPSQMVHKNHDVGRLRIWQGFIGLRILMHVAARPCSATSRQNTAWPPNKQETRFWLRLT